MLTILHGNDTALSRKNFFEEKQKIENAVLLEADQINLTDLAQLFDGGGLFNETKYLFVEQFLTKRKKSSDYKEIITYMQKRADKNTIFLWENKELEISILKGFPKAIIKAFKLPQTLFQLLDTIRPKNHKEIIKLFHETVENTETEMVFFMLVRQFRILLALHENPNEDNPIEELRRLAPWQKTKFEKQSHSFELSHLLNLYEKLFAIEVNQKTGALTSSLICTIDFFLLGV
jgi:hypothetical protein